MQFIFIEKTNNKKQSMRKCLCFLELILSWSVDLVCTNILGVQTLQCQVSAHDYCKGRHIMAEPALPGRYLLPIASCVRLFRT